MTFGRNVQYQYRVVSVFV